MARLKKIIKTFEFIEENRRKITLYAGGRLHPDKNVLTLKEPASSGEVRTWLTTPTSMKRMIGFMATDVRPAGSTITYRLSNGTQDFFWNGSAWVVANPANWNTEAEIATNISSYSIATHGQSFQFVIKMTAPGVRYYPQLQFLQVLYESDLEEVEDYIWRSLVPSLRSNIRVIGEHMLTLAAASNTISLETYRIETPYNIEEIDSVYNKTADPLGFADLFQSYNANTKVITLSSTLPANAVVMVRFVYRPEISVTTGQDYTQLDKVPSIVIENIAKSLEITPPGVDYVVNRATGSGWATATTQADLEGEGRFITDKAKDHARLADEIRRYFAERPFLRSRGMDDEFRLWLIDDYRQDTSPNKDDLHNGRFRFRIVQALFFDTDAVAIHGTLNFELATFKASS